MCLQYIIQDQWIIFLKCNFSKPIEQRAECCAALSTFLVLELTLTELILQTTRCQKRGFVKMADFGQKVSLSLRNSPVLPSLRVTVESREIVKRPRAQLSDKSDITLGPKVHCPMTSKLSIQNQVILPDVLSDDKLAFMQDRTMMPVVNLDETCVKLERCLRIPLDETMMDPYCEQHMAVLSTLKPVVVSSFDHVGTREPPKI